MTTAPPPLAEWTEELLDLVAQEATGRVVLSGAAGEQGWLYLRDGLVSGVSASARRPLLAHRLIAFDALPAPQVQRALAAVRQQPGMRLLDLIVSQRLVAHGFVETFLRNVMAEHVAVMLHGPGGELRLEAGRVQRSTPLLVDLHDVLTIASVVPFAFPEEIADHSMTAIAGSFAAAAAIHRSVMTASDGRRRPVDVADECGLTAGETLQVMAELQQHGALELAPPSSGTWSDPLTGAAPLPGAGAAPATLQPAAVHVPPATTLPDPAAPTPAPPKPTAPESPPPPPVVTPFTPAAVEEVPPPQRAAHTGESRREALSALKNLTDAIADPGAAHADPPPTEVAPQAEVTTTGRVWANRPVRPADPMESGDVLRELKSLGD